MTDETLKYKIGITLVDGIGIGNAKKMIAYAGGVDQLFTLPLEELKAKVPVNDLLIEALREPGILQRAEEEIAFLEAQNSIAHFYLDKTYPHRLKMCDDGPIVLYQKGNGTHNSARMLGVVGTRNCTEYGRKVCNNIIDGLKDFGVTIVSGLAYGIDIAAHRAALQAGLPTFAVVAHGLHTLYPGEHHSIAEKMMDTGGLLTDYNHTSPFHPSNFPSRNRIVAGMCDATLVIETPDKGGSLITANIANSYGRDVFAVPGRAGDKTSEGCNRLIRTNHAHLVESAEQIAELMGWSKHNEKKVQKTIFIDLSDADKAIIELLKEGPVPIDELCAKAKTTTGKLSAQLLNLEFSGVVRSLPGKVYELA